MNVEKYLLLITVIFLLYLYKYIRFIVRRFFLMIRLLILKRNKYISMDKLSISKFISFKSGDSSDIIIRKNEKVFVVKLVGDFKRRYAIIFSEAFYTFMRYFVLPLPIYKPDPGIKEVKINFNLGNEMDYIKNKDNNTEGIQYQGIYLACPKPLYASDNTKHLFYGDLINGCYYYTSKSFLKMLKDGAM